METTIYTDGTRFRLYFLAGWLPLGETAPVPAAQLERAFRLAGAHGHWWASALWDAARAQGADPQSAADALAALGPLSPEGIEALCAEHGSEWGGVGYGPSHTTTTGRLAWSVLTDGTTILRVFRPSREQRAARERVRLLGVAHAAVWAAHASGQAVEALMPEWGALADDEEPSDDLRSRDAAATEANDRARDAARSALRAAGIEVGTDACVAVAGDRHDIASAEVADYVSALLGETREAGHRGPPMEVLRAIVGPDGATTVRDFGGALLRHWICLRDVVSVLGAALPPDALASQKLARYDALLAERRAAELEGRDDTQISAELEEIWDS